MPTIFGAAARHVVGPRSRRALLPTEYARGAACVPGSSGLRF
jgi:hypothetical protein